MPFLDTPTFRQAGERTWEMTKDLMYAGETQGFEIPAGFVTDFATVPRVLQWLVPTYGGYTRAAVLHDYLIEHELSRERPRLTSRDVDGLFRRVMREEGVPWPRRWVMWAAVRAAAPFNPDRRKGLGIARDLPVMLLAALYVFANPFVGPTVVGASLSLLLIKIFGRALPFVAMSGWGLAIYVWVTR